MNDPVALLETVRRQLADGQSLSGISRTTGVSLDRLIAVCRENQIRYPNKRFTLEEREAALDAVLIDGKSIREAANQIGRSRSSVSRHVIARRRAITSHSGSFDPKPVPEYRCPIHGPTVLSPCPACAAMAAKEQQTANRE